MNLLDEDRKRLASFLNELQPVRFFNSYQDAGEMCEKLVEKGMWRIFCDLFAFGEWGRAKQIYSYNGEFIAWLMTNPSRLCWLCNKFLKENEK